VPKSTPTIFFRVITCLENLEMSGNSTAISEMAGNLLKVEEVSGKKSCQLLIVSCIFASILDFAEFLHLFLDHALLHSYPHH